MILFMINFVALQRAPEELNIRSSDVWSFGILLWELNTREVPFADLTPMEAGMKVCIHFCCWIKAVFILLHMYLYFEFRSRSKVSVLQFRLEYPDICSA